LKYFSANKNYAVLNFKKTIKSLFGCVYNVFFHTCRDCAPEIVKLTRPTNSETTTQRSHFFHPNKRALPTKPLLMLPPKQPCDYIPVCSTLSDSRSLYPLPTPESQSRPSACFTAQAQKYSSLSLPKPGLSRGFQAEPGRHITMDTGQRVGERSVDVAAENAVRDKNSHLKHSSMS
jgi:hypothetical protein